MEFRGLQKKQVKWESVESTRWRNLIPHRIGILLRLVFDTAAVQGVSGQAGDGHLAKACLGLLGKAGKDHRDMIADVLISGAGNNDAVAMNLPAVTWRLKG